MFPRRLRHLEFDHHRGRINGNTGVGGEAEKAPPKKLARNTLAPSGREYSCSQGELLQRTVLQRTYLSRVCLSNFNLRCLNSCGFYIMAYAFWATPFTAPPPQSSAISVPDNKQLACKRVSRFSPRPKFIPVMYKSSSSGPPYATACTACRPLQVIDAALTAARVVSPHATRAKHRTPHETVAIHNTPVGHRRVRIRNADASMLPSLRHAIRDGIGALLGIKRKRFNAKRGRVGVIHCVAMPRNSVGARYARPNFDRWLVFGPPRFEHPKIRSAVDQIVILKISDQRSTPEPPKGIAFAIVHPRLNAHPRSARE